MSNYHDGYLQQGQQMGAVYLDILLSANNQIINPVNATLIRLQSDNTTASNRIFTIQGTSQVGAELTLMFISGASSTCELDSTGNMQLTQAWTPTQYNTLVIQWQGTFWQEVARSNTAISPALTSGQILVGSGSNVAAAVTPSGDVSVSNTGVFTITPTSAQAAGINMARVLIATFDPSANAGQRTIAAHTFSVALPAKAILTQVFYQVITTFTSATDAGTIALSVEGANDLVSAIAISDGSNPWNAGGTVSAIPTGTAATMVKTTIARMVTATVAVEALTAGKLYIYADFVQGF